MPVTRKAAVVVWDRISSVDAEGKNGRARTRTTGEKKDKRNRKELGLRAQNLAQSEAGIDRGETSEDPKFTRRRPGRLDRNKVPVGSSNGERDTGLVLGPVDPVGPGKVK
jgi:hypothetical protein